MENQPQYTPATQNQQILLLNLGIVAALILCAVAVALYFTGYGTLRLNGIPSGATIRVNGHLVTARTLRVLPGNYRLVVWSPATEPLEATVSVRPFSTTTYMPKPQPRSAQAIVSSTIGAIGQNGAPEIGLVRWFAGNTWLAGAITPGATVAMHYDQTQHAWEVAYYTGGGYPEDLSVLPPDVAAYITSIGRQDV